MSVVSECHGCCAQGNVKAQLEATYREGKPPESPKPSPVQPQPPTRGFYALVRLFPKAAGPGGTASLPFAREQRRLAPHADC